MTEAKSALHFRVKWMKVFEGPGPRRAVGGQHKSRRHSVPSPSSDTEASRDGDRQNTSTPAEASDEVLNGVDWSQISDTPFHTRLDTAGLVSDTPQALVGSILTTSVTDQLSSVDILRLQSIYKEGFDVIFGSWMGRHGCPFLYGGNSLADKHVSISDVCRRLDDWVTHTEDNRFTHESNGERHPDKNIRDAFIDESLQSAINAFSAGWLPLTSRRSHRDFCHQNIIHALWRQARKDMLRVINRPSYRSMLTPFLFSLTPIPASISEEEELYGISGQTCVHAALQQIQTLRAKQRTLQFNGSKASCSLQSKTTCDSPGSIRTSDFITAESIAYWAALTFDTSASLTLNCRTLLSSGLFGFESELPWRLVWTGAKMFQEATQNWLPDSVLGMTDEKANQIIATGTAWKLLAWKSTAVFKEALIDGHEESEVRKAYTYVHESIKQFNGTYRKALEVCQRRMQFLGQRTKLRWYSLMLHYHLSILMLVDIIEAVDRCDLLPGIAEATADAENAVMDALVFGLNNTYTVGARYGSSSKSVEGNSAEGAVTVPLISIDPYPHHVVACVLLIRKAIDRDLALGKVCKEAHASLESTLKQTLSRLPQTSKSIQAARNRF